MAQSVVWKAKVAGRLVTGAMPQLRAVAVPELIMLAKAVAEVPTCTERLLGKTDATREVKEVDILATKASVPPLSVRSGPTVTGKVAAVEVVEPVI